MLSVEIFAARSHFEIVTEKDAVHWHWI